MITGLFGWVALFHGAIAFTVLIASVVVRLRRGKNFAPQFYIALVMVGIWVSSNVTYVGMKGYPTVNDLSFPILDVIGAAFILFIGLFSRNLIFWMKMLWAITTTQLIFHIPYMVTYGEIISHYEYHLALNIIFDIQNLIVFVALFVPRRVWLYLDLVTEHIVLEYVYYPISCMLPKKKSRRRHFSVDTKTKAVV